MSRLLAARRAAFCAATWLRKLRLSLFPRSAADIATFSALEDKTLEFESLLKQHGITVRPGSEFEAACLATMDLKHRRDTKQTAVTDDLRPALRVVVGLRQLVEMTLLNRSHAEFSRLVPHLSLLNEGSPTQNTPAPRTDEASNKLLELLVALATMRDGKDLDLDDPKESSGGRNPDVVTTMPDGRRWGFACKVVHGDAPMSLFDLIEKGVRQIDAAPVDVGIVVLSFKNKLPHDQLFATVGQDAHGESLYAAPRPSAEIIGALKLFADQRLRGMAAHLNYEELYKVFDRSKALPGVLAISEAAVPLQTPKGVAASLVGITHLTHLERPGAQTRFTCSVNAVFRSLNDALHLR